MLNLVLFHIDCASKVYPFLSTLSRGFGRRAGSCTGVTGSVTLMDYSRLGRRPRDLQYGWGLQGRSWVPGALFGVTPLLDFGSLILQLIMGSFEPLIT